jgi:hypothetical protein
MGILLAELLDEDPQFAEVVLEEFLNEKGPRVDHLEDLHEYISENARNNVIEAYKKRPENADVKYIVPGTSTDHLEDTTIVPKLCDIQACRVVHPFLFKIISRGYPSTKEIMHNTSMKLSALPPFNESSRDLSAWLTEKQEFFTEYNAQVQVEVRQSGDMLDVPLFIIEMGKIIFSERALRIKESNPRMFLDIVHSALKESLEGIQMALPVQEVEKQPVVIPRIIKHVDSATEIDAEVKNDAVAPVLPAKQSLDFTSDFALPHDAGEIDDNDDEAIEKLERSLTETIFFGKYKIHCTPDAYNAWMSHANLRVNALTKRSINACYQALSTLSETATLSFYIALDSDMQGFASENDGIHINLRSVLLDEQVEEAALKAYFDVLIAHEYAHYVKSEDNHGPMHGRRTESNLQKILQKLYNQ